MAGHQIVPQEPNVQKIKIWTKNRNGQPVLFKKISFNENLTRCQGVQLLVYGRQKTNNGRFLARLEFAHQGRILLAQATIAEERISSVSKVTL